MKKLLALTISLLLAANASAALTNVTIGAYPGDPSGDSPRAAFIKVNWNFDWLESLMLAVIPDSLTNSILSSPRYVTLTTNSVTIGDATNTVVGWVTNYAGADYSFVVGFAMLQYSTDGTNWSAANELVATNVPVKLRFDTGTLAAIATPITTVVTNFSAYSLTRPDLFGREYWTYGERVHVAWPITSDEATSKSYVDAAVAAVNPYQSNGIFLAGSPLNLDGTWQALGTSNSYSVRYLGVEAWNVSAPALSYAHINSISLSGNTVTLNVSTNGITSTPAPQFTTDLAHPIWQLVNNVTNGYPTAVGTNYVLTFPKPATNSCFIRIGFGNAYPNVLTLGGILSAPMRTITNSTDSTFGRGSGLLCWDADYIYVSTATNTWMRAALSTW